MSLPYFLSKDPLSVTTTKTDLFVSLLFTFNTVPKSCLFEAEVNWLLLYTYPEAVNFPSNPFEYQEAISALADTLKAIIEAIVSFSCSYR